MTENNMRINRSFNIRSIDNESRTIEGQSIVYDSWSRDLGGFIERIEPGAVTEELLLNSDIIMNYNHDDNQMLARYTKGEGTLRLELREDGLYFSFDAPETALGDEILYHIRNGNLTECSFACTISRDNIRRFKDEEGRYVQVIEKIDGLYDCSVVSRAAYGSTSVAARDGEPDDKEFEEIKQEVDEKEILDELNSLRDNFLSEIS